ncbi:MAG: hypothetical protein GX595_05465 [Lentisphaerae bacterium]|nr:hypothetical protein [Lentisphaerota bacterium]
MTVRAVVFGLLGAVLVCGTSFLNDRVLRQTYLVGNNMPVSVYGILILVVLCINPLLRRWRFSGRELAVVMALTLASCCLPGSGLLRTFASALVLPYHYEKLEPSWREEQILSYIPERMVPDIASDEDTVLGGFVQGLGTPGNHIRLRAVPWSAWVRPVLFWMPMVLTLWVAMIALAVVLHRQWSGHEHLPYPIAAFADSLLPSEADGRVGLFRQRLFWVGALAVLLIHTNNYLCTWFPDIFIPISLRFSFSPLARFFPTLVRGGGWSLFTPTLFFSVIGICFLIPTDLSFTFGIGPWLWALVVGVFAAYGLNLNNVVEGSCWYTGLKPRMFILFGANVGLFLALLYTGRHFYGQVAARACGLSRRGAVDGLSVWGCRVFLAAMAAFTILVTAAGVDWQLAVMYSGVLVVFYVVMSRIVSEAGLFHVQSNIFPCCILWGFMGAPSLGPRTLLLLQVISMILIIDPRESLLPFMSNSLQLLERRREALGRPAIWCGVAVVVGLAVALPLTLYIHYDQGNAIWESWADRDVPTMQYQNAIAVQRKLAAQDMLASSLAVSGWGRFRQMAPNAACVWGFAGGMALVMAFSAARLRFRHWPLHPLLFVTWCTTHISSFAGSFLLGSLIKWAVLKYGGNRTYDRLRPLMVGLIAGEILGALLPSLVGALYYVITGERPKAFRVMLS